MNHHGYVRSRNGITHVMRDASVSQCGREFVDGVRLANATRVGMCGRCRRVTDLKRDLLARVGGEEAKMRLLRELAEIVNRRDDESI